MPRGAEVVRQWNLLQAVDAARNGVTVADLARTLHVTKRTVWRDLAALQEAGFPLYDEKDHGTTRWRMNHEGFKQLVDRGLTLTQLCALYFSRSLVEVLAGTPFHEELKGVFDQLETALPTKMRAFLDRLPGVLKAKPGPAKRHDEARQQETVARLLDATLHHRRVAMRYHSLSSQRTKDYTVDPYRIVDVGPLRVALIGITGQGQVEGLEIRDPIEATKDIVAEVGGQAQVLILLSHAGFERNREIAAQVPALDLIVSGGGPQMTYVAEGGDGTPLLVHADVSVTGHAGRRIGVGTFTFDGTGVLRAQEWQPVALDAQIPDDPQMSAWEASHR